MYKFNISPKAANDLTEIKDYVCQELGNPQVATNLISKILKKIHGLEEHPMIGAPLTSVIDIQSNYRFLACDNYLIFYRCEDEKIFVLRILYGRRDYIRILCGDFLADE